MLLWEIRLASSSFLHWSPSYLLAKEPHGFFLPCCCGSTRERPSPLGCWTSGVVITTSPVILPLCETQWFKYPFRSASKTVLHTEQMEAKKNKIHRRRYHHCNYLFIYWLCITGGGGGILYGFWSLSHHLILRTTANKIIVYISVNIILGSTKNPGSLQVLLLSKTTRSY